MTSRKYNIELNISLIIIFVLFYYIEFLSKTLTYIIKYEWAAEERRNKDEKRAEEKGDNY